MKKSLSTLLFLVFISFSSSLLAQYDSHYLKSGNTALSAENYAQAELDYTTSLKHNSRNMEAYFQRGVARFHLQKYNEATSDFDRIVLFNYKKAEAAYWKGRIAYLQQNYKAAIQQFDNALNEDASQKSEIYTYKGFAYQKLNKLTEAEKNLNLALNEGAKDQANIYYELANINFYQEKYKESLDNLQQARKYGHPNRLEIAKKIVKLDELINANKGVEFNFLNPQTLTSSTSQAFFDLEVCLQSELMISEVKVFVNAIEQDPVRGLVVTPKTDCAINFSRKIPLQKGSNQIQLVAQTAKGEFKSETRTVEYNPVRAENTLAVTSLPRVWAVVVGIATYSHMPTLRYSDDDAYQMYAFLKSPEGGALPDDQITLLVDENASKQNIISALSAKFAAAGTNDLVLFYYAGHGLEGSFIPFDYNGTESTKLMHKDVQEIFTSSKAKNKLFVADACHSGSSSQDFRNVEKAVTNYYKALASTSGGTALMMSSKAEETSIENKGLRQGVFSHYLIRGLKGEADFDSNGIITVRELFDYAQTQTRQYTQYRQNPELFGLFDPNMPIGAVRK